MMTSKSNNELADRYMKTLSDDRKLAAMLGTQGKSFLATGFLKNTTNNSMNCLVSNKVFEWVRGAAMSGWVIKWPRVSEKSSGFATKRYLVLKDNILVYYVDPPTDALLSRYIITLTLPIKS